MYARGGKTEARVAFVGDQHQTAGIRNNKIRTGDAGISSQILASHEVARAAGDRLGIVIVVAEAFPFETAGDVAAVLVNDRLDDVAGVVAVDLDDVFAEIGFNGFDALRGKVVVEMDLLRDHALGFDDLFRSSFF